VKKEKKEYRHEEEKEKKRKLDGEFRNKSVGKILEIRYFFS
jgi:hypothetical protein